jgi:guanine deaminase
MPKNDIEFAVLGTYMHAPTLGEVEVVESALIEVGTSGAIDRILRPDDPDYKTRCQSATNKGCLSQLGEGQYLLPGLVDLHVHAPQWPQMGKALDVPLNRWLQEHTFPLEARYEDCGFASRVYESLVSALLANGTTSALYFATIHQESSILLGQICLEYGQRAFVGKVAMDNPDQCPDFYCEPSASAGIAATEAFINGVKALPNNRSGLVQPVVTPRFIPSCTDEMLHGLGSLASQYDCHVQTHCSESDWEHQYVLDRFGRSDTQCLADFGLATDKSVYAHANMIGETDLAILHEAGVGIAHCPMSNVYFSNAVFPARRVLEAGINVGLGTDIAGGPSPSVLVNAHMAVSMSRALEDGVDGTLTAASRGVADSRISYQEAFWMATTGGGLALKTDVGVFKPGYYFDAIVVDLDAEGSNVVMWPELDGAEDLLQKIVFNANRQNICKVWVNGQTVVDHTSNK